MTAAGPSGTPPQPPADTQQDNPSSLEAWREHAAVLLSPEQARRRDPVEAVARNLADAYAAGLAARPSADTETLRRVRELADEWLRDGTAPQQAIALRAALDGSR